MRLTSPIVDTLAIEEQAAVIIAVNLGEKFGYGNLMAHLATAWAIKLRAQGMSQEAAIEHVSGRGTLYPLPVEEAK